MKNNDAACARWFQQATGNEPAPYQMRFADGDWLRNAVPVPGHRPFNPANCYHPDNPLNPANKYNPTVPFAPLDGGSGTGKKR